MQNREFKFGYQHFLLCQKSFLKVSSKWLLKNKSDNGKLLLGKTYSGERFRAILALLFFFFFFFFFFFGTISWILMKLHRNYSGMAFFRNSPKNLIPVRTVVAMETTLENIENQ